MTRCAASSPAGNAPRDRARILAHWPRQPRRPLEAPVSPSFTFALIRSGAGTPDPFTGR